MFPSRPHLTLIKFSFFVQTSISSLFRDRSFMINGVLNYKHVRQNNKTRITNLLIKPKPN